MVWVKLDCPRCTATSSIDAALAGQYVICPACQARVLVPINAPPAAPPPAPQSPIGNQPAAASAANLRKTVQASSLQTWAGGQPLPSAPQPAATGPGTGNFARQPQASAASLGRGNPVPAAPAIAASAEYSSNSPLADVPLLPPRADSPQPAAPPAAPPGPSPHAAQPVRAAYAGGPPPMAGGGMIPMPVPGGVPAAPPRPMPMPVPMPMGVAPPAVAPPTVAPLAPAGSRKVARFIAAESAQSTIQLAADGQLPSLQLIEAGKTVAETTKASSMNPLLVLGAIAASFCMCVMLLTTDIGSGGADQKLDEARQQLETYYKGQRGPLLPYQIRLREAQQAHSRGADRTARDQYRKVLDLLHAEGGDRFHGLTGTPASDKRLEEILSILLGQDVSFGLPMDEP